MRERPSRSFPDSHRTPVRAAALAACRAVFGTALALALCNGLSEHPTIAAEVVEGPLRAGAAAVDVTPPLGEDIVGGFRPFPATAVHDPLFARALVLDNGQTRLAIVIVDSLGIPREVCDEARRAVAESVPIEPWNLLIAATHTHSGTRASSPKYRPKLVAGIAAAVKTAAEHLEPAEIGWGAVDEPSEVFNRRWFVTDPELLKNPFGGVDKVRMNPPRGSPALVRPAGPTDPQVSFVAVRAVEDARPIALLANYSSGCSATAPAAT